MTEFSGIRSRLYKQALAEYPKAREEEIKAMKKYLIPKKRETILEVGAGSGFFSGHIADLIGEKGKLIVSDPSKEQLEEIRNLNKKNIEILQKGAEEINLKEESIDSIWSFGAMHHSFKKQEAFNNFKRILNKGGKVVIVDVFKDSKLAKHFDEKVDKYCITGHKVEFWTNELAEKLCKSVGLQKPEIINLDIKWKFKTKEEIGDFLYKIHAMTKTTKEECLKGAEEILGVEKIGNLYHLNWPMKVIISKN